MNSCGTDVAPGSCECALFGRPARREALHVCRAGPSALTFHKQSVSVKDDAVLRLRLVPRPRGGYVFTSCTARLYAHKVSLPNAPQNPGLNVPNAPFLRRSACDLDLSLSHNNPHSRTLPNSQCSPIYHFST
jgi:hypothetical protein